MKNKLLIPLLFILCISTIGTASASYILTIGITDSHGGVGNEYTWYLSKGSLILKTLASFPTSDGEYVELSSPPNDYGLYQLNGTFVTKGVSLSSGNKYTYLIFHPSEVNKGDYILKVRWNNTKYKNEWLLGSERWVLIHVVP